LIIDDLRSIIKLTKYDIFDKKKERRLRLLQALLDKFSVVKMQKEYNSNFIQILRKESMKIDKELTDFYSNLNLPLSKSITKFLSREAKFIKGKL